MPGEIDIGDQGLFLFIVEPLSNAAVSPYMRVFLMSQKPLKIFFLLY